MDQLAWAHGHVVIMAHGGLTSSPQVLPKQEHVMPVLVVGPMGGALPRRPCLQGDGRRDARAQDASWSVAVRLEVILDVARVDPVSGRESSSQRPTTQTSSYNTRERFREAGSASGLVSVAPQVKSSRDIWNVSMFSRQMGTACSRE